IKHWMRMAQGRSLEAVFNALADTIATFSPQECRNFFKKAGYASN
ncbi:MAG: IS630 family transposase, partial [Alphaproteobacteria bacterium]